MFLGCIQLNAFGWRCARIEADSTRDGLIVSKFGDWKALDWGALSISRFTALFLLPIIWLVLLFPPTG
jgi:hypothetical protein